MSKLSPKLHEEDVLSSLEMSSIKAGQRVQDCGCSCTISRPNNYEPKDLEDGLSNVTYTTGHNEKFRTQTGVLIMPCAKTQLYMSPSHN